LEKIKGESMTTSKPGYLGKVALGVDKVLGIGNWSMDGMSLAEMDDTELGDEATKYVLGIMDGGSISFAGNHKPGDTSGQLALLTAFDARTELTDLRFYIDETSYYVPCQTAGYLHPGKTTGANTAVSNVVMKSAPVNYDKGSLGQVSFSVRVNGNMVLV
jgi:hypothetical protein